MGSVALMADLLHRPLAAPTAVAALHDFAYASFSASKKQCAQCARACPEQHSACQKPAHLFPVISSLVSWVMLRRPIESWPSITRSVMELQ